MAEGAPGKPIDEKSIETMTHWSEYHKKQYQANRPFAGPGHVTYPSLNLRPDTLWIPKNENSRKK